MKAKVISIKWKIFFFLIGFCGILLFILWMFQMVFLENFYKSIKINDIKSAASTILKNIENDNLTAIVDRISKGNYICIEILSKNGNEVYSSDVLRDCFIHRIDPFKKATLLVRAIEKGGELLEYLNRGVLTEIESQDTLDMAQSIIYAKVLNNSAGETVVVFLNSVITPVSSTVNTLRIQLYYITGAMLVCSIILALIIAKHVSKPIININESAKVLAKGSYDTEFKGKSYKEISELADTLNFTAKELSKVEKLRRELIANISHDLRTPLTLISGYAEVMRDIPDENNAENAQIIIDESRRLNNLVNDVLDISKLESGVPIDLKEYNLTESIKQTVIRLSELLRNENFFIEFNYKQEIFVTADETKISQAFYNLLINAVNYSGEDKTIMVNQIELPNKVIIEVKDTGEGISEESLPYIWERYYKEDKTHKRAITGTGLGLSIVKHVIDSHNGEYGVSSRLGQGSTFWFSLNI